MTRSHLCVCAARATDAEHAQHLSQQLKYPYCDNCAAAAQQSDWLLHFSAQGLSLQENHSNTQLRVDFISGKSAHRRRYGGGRGQPLARAVGLKAAHTPSLIDATAGLGRDAFVLASLGCTVQLIERSPIIAALLADGLRRAQADPEIGDWVAQRLALHQGDAFAYLQQRTLAQFPEVIYLDPMYPARKKTALVKKDMRLLQQLLGQDEDSPDEDSPALLEMALQRARRRVVVKRPKAAPPLSTHPPDVSISSKNTRFDIYLMHL